jgi:2-polyprenyl-3-methyl-5-hydroxy-6-metoxy-1,4-benzoquinol methylase
MKQPIACPACSGQRTDIVKQWRLAKNKRKARAVACQDCGLLFVHPQPPPADLESLYSPGGGWEQSRPEKPRKPAATRTKGAAPAMFEALDAYFAASRPPAGARVFDFGCGPGTWLNSFQDHGWETFGLEPSSSEAFERHTRLDAIPADPQFDLVIVYHVLEHLPRPLDTIRELAQSLRPGGHCFIGVPRLDTLAVHQQVDYCLHPNHHIVGFTEACLRGLLARAGLEVAATFHDLDSVFSKGVPARMRLLARKTITPPAPVEDPASALVPVIKARAGLTASVSLESVSSAGSG